MFAQIPALIQRAVHHFQQGELPQAGQLLQQVLDRQPRNFDALHILGVIRAMEGERNLAIVLFRKALTISRNNSFLHFNLAKALSESGLDEQALPHHRKATQLAPQYAEAWLNLGRTYLNLDNLNEALKAFEQALNVAPDFAEAWSNRGIVLKQWDRLNEALGCHEMALKLKPDLAEAHLNKGSVLEDLGNDSAAIQSYSAALRLNPDYVDARWNIATLNLKHGNFQAGWEDFECRWKKQDHMTPALKSRKPMWTGNRSSHPLLLWGEQGVGDQILYASILSELADLPQRKLVALDKRLLPLFARSIPGFEFIDLDQVSDALDFAEQLPLGSLPRYFRPSRESFAAARHPYLVADPARTAELRQKITQDGKLTCGISWSSNRKSIGRQKSIRLEQLLVPLASSKRHFVNLQYGNTAAERAALQTQHDIAVQNVDEIDNFQDIDGLAALIAACDLIITTSNTTAHLAGALGKETLLLLPFAKGKLWYWNEMEGHNPWYPSVRMFTQTQAGDWDDAVANINGQLEGRLWD